MMNSLTKVVGLLALAACGNAKSNFTESCPSGGTYCAYQGSSDRITMAMVGDPGADRWFDLGNPTRDIAGLVLDWQPDFILSPGDNSYFWGFLEDMSESMRNYATYIKYPVGSTLNESKMGSDIQRFWTAVGNHEWKFGAVNQTGEGGCTPQIHMDYFATYPNNKRYFSVRFGCPDATNANCLVELFVLSLNNTKSETCSEADGTTIDGVQGTWFKSAISSSTATWKVLIGHIPTFSSGPNNYGAQFSPMSFGTYAMANGGADLHLGGDDHDYERFMNRTYGMPMIVNGFSGFTKPAQFNFQAAPIEGSVVMWELDYVHTSLVYTATNLVITTNSRSGILVDKLQISKVAGQQNTWTELMDRLKFNAKWGLPANGKMVYLTDDFGQIGWKMSTYSTRTYPVNYQMTIYWQSNDFDVWRLANKAAYDICDFTGATMIVISGFSRTTGVWGVNGASSAWTNGWWGFPLYKPGTWYLADSTNCNAGMKFILNVVSDMADETTTAVGPATYNVVFNN